LALQALLITELLCRQDIYGVVTQSLWDFKTKSNVLPGIQSFMSGLSTLGFRIEQNCWTPEDFVGDEERDYFSQTCSGIVAGDGSVLKGKAGFGIVASQDIDFSQLHIDTKGELNYDNIDRDSVIRTFYSIKGLFKTEDFVAPPTVNTAEAFAIATMMGTADNPDEILSDSAICLLNLQTWSSKSIRQQFRSTAPQAMRIAHFFKHESKNISKIKGHQDGLKPQQLMHSLADRVANPEVDIGNDSLVIDKDTALCGELHCVPTIDGAIFAADLVSTIKDKNQQEVCSAWTARQVSTKPSELPGSTALWAHEAWPTILKIALTSVSGFQFELLRAIAVNELNTKTVVNRTCPLPDIKCPCGKMDFVTHWLSCSRFQSLRRVTFRKMFTACYNAPKAKPSESLEVELRITLRILRKAPNLQVAAALVGLPFGIQAGWISRLKLTLKNITAITIPIAMDSIEIMYHRSKPWRPPAACIQGY
jgi:hypothetical protein